MDRHPAPYVERLGPDAYLLKAGKPEFAGFVEVDVDPHALRSARAKMAPSSLRGSRSMTVASMRPTSSALAAIMAAGGRPLHKLIVHEGRILARERLVV